MTVLTWSLVAAGGRAASAAEPTVDTAVTVLVTIKSGTSDCGG
jgi:hypothetical protein